MTPKFCKAAVALFAKCQRLALAFTITYARGVTGSVQGFTVSSFLTADG